MKSTDYNLNNPMVTDSIELYPNIEIQKYSNIIHLTMEQFKLITTKDPTSIYIIIDSPDKKVYYGELLANTSDNRRLYLLGPSSKFGEYVIYLNEPVMGIDKLVKISKYDNPQQAINDLNRFNNIGSHISRDIQIHNIICQYISGDISIHDLITGVISLFGYRDNIALQTLLRILKTYNIDQCCKDLPIILKQDLIHLKRNGNVLFKFNSNLYDLITSYQFFKGKEFQKDYDTIDSSKVIRDIHTIMTN